MLSTVLVGFVCVIAGLVAAAVAVRRRQRALGNQRETVQLQRRGDHLFKIALAAQVHTRNNAIAETLLDEAVRVLHQAQQLAPHNEATLKLLRECRELIANIEAEPKTVTTEMRDPFLDFPQTELIEAQMHLTEAARLLIGLEKRGQISYDALSAMNIDLKQSQRELDLRLQLTTQTVGSDSVPAKIDDPRTGEYLAAQEENRVHPSH